MNQQFYYCLIAGLPELVPDDKKLNFSSVALREYLFDELSKPDFDLVSLLYLHWDNENILNLVFKKNKEWDIRGNYPRELFEQLIDPKQFDLLESGILPQYLINFAQFVFEEEDELNEASASHFITESYYNYLLSCNNKFISETYRLKLNIGNIMLALNGRKHNFATDDTLIGRNEVTNALKKSRARDFGLSVEMPDIEKLIQIYETENILERELKLDNYIWHFLDETTFFNYFTIEKVLAFVLKIFMAERWFNLDKEKGQEMFNNLLNDIQSNFQFPEEFTANYGKKK